VSDIDTNALTTRTTLRPSFEGSNIRTWIGFKHLMYLAQEAVIDHLRERGAGPQRMFAQFGLRLKITESSFAFLSLLEADDAVMTEVVQTRNGHFQVRLLREGAAGAIPLAKGHIEASYVAAECRSAATPVPQDLQQFTAPGSFIAHKSASHSEVNLSDALWNWTARYYLCQFSDCVQHSAYIRALEETVDRYLATRGLTIGRVLADRKWIPVVSRARVRVLADVRMEEVVHTMFAVDDVFKTMGYSGSMNCYVEREGRAVHVATAAIVHGYAIAEGEGMGQLTALDDSTIAALSGGRQ
jgi:acyl-CoA thioesterase FadM